MKKIVSLIISLALMSFMSLNVFAASEAPKIDDPGITPNYLYTSSITSTLGISGKTASCKSVIYGFSSSATKIEVTQLLQKKSGSIWETQASWKTTYNTWYCCFTNSKSSLPGGTYRLKTIAKVYKGSNYETVTAYSKEVGC